MMVLVGMAELFGANGDGTSAGEAVVWMMMKSQKYSAEDGNCQQYDYVIGKKSLPTILPKISSLSLHLFRLLPGQRVNHPIHFIATTITSEVVLAA